MHDFAYIYQYMYDFAFIYQYMYDFIKRVLLISLIKRLNSII